MAYYSNNCYYKYLYIYLNTLICICHEPNQCKTRGAGYQKDVF